MGKAVELEVDPKSLRELYKKMQTDYLIDVPADKFYDSIAIKIGKKAQAGAPVDRGDVKRGIKVLKDKKGRSVVATAPHSIYAHEDTRPHWPPIDALRGWAKRHGIEPYLVAKSISEKGTTGVPFLKDAADEVFDSLQPGMKAFARSVEQRFGR